MVEHYSSVMQPSFLLLLLLPIISGESDFFDAQLASKTISVPYSNAALTVYQHKIDMNRYYVAPIGIFRVDTMKIEKHPLTKVYGLKFSVVLTNSHIRNTVVQYLALKLSNCASSSSVCTVELVPTDRVRLHWSTDSGMDSEYALDKAWHINTNLQDHVDFIVGCTSEHSCLELYNDTKEAPETFVKGLQLEYMTTGSEMPSRTIQLNSSYVKSHRRYTNYRQLAEQNTSMNNGQIYISNHDKNELLSAIARDSLAQQIEDEGYEPDDADSQTDLVKLLNEMLISEKTTLESHTDLAWKSLYWHENNQRPDEAVKTLEKILAHLKNKNYTKSCNDTQTSVDDSSGRGISVNAPKQLLEKLPKIGPIIGLLAADDKYYDDESTEKQKKKKTKKKKPKVAQSDDKESTNDDDDEDGASRRRKRFLFNYNDENHHKMNTKSNYCPEDLLNTFNKNEKNIEWSGASFKVKPMTVYRLNVGNYSDAASMTIKKVKVKLRKNIHSVALRSSTAIIANASSDELVPKAFGVLWVSVNLTKLQHQFEEYKQKMNVKFQSHYSKLAVEYYDLNRTFTALLKRTKLEITDAFNNNLQQITHLNKTTKYMNSTINRLILRSTKLVARQNATRIKLACWRRAKFELKHVIRYCE